MLHIVYPSVRVGRILSIALPVFRITESVSVSIVGGLLCDFTSIVLDARPFFKSWTQFLWAALFFHFFYESYWEQFRQFSSLSSYVRELACIFSLLCAYQFMYKVV